jgi:PKD domain-containing protein
MRRLLAVVIIVSSLGLSGTANADGEDIDGVVETIPDAVRVTLIKVGGEHTVASVAGGGTGQQGCRWTVVFVDELDEAPYGTDFGAKPDPDARLALLLCNGMIVQPIWVAPDDVIDVDAAARDEAQRYIEDVLVPAVRIGVNPAARGLVGLPSWFWIDGFDGQVSAPPISAFGLTIEVRMSSGTVTWDFGDGTVETGDLGRAYPEESTVQHVHQRDGTYTITASIDLVPEYRVDGGPWTTLPNLQVVATASHAVEEREAVVTQT